MRPKTLEEMKESRARVFAAHVALDPRPGSLASPIHSFTRGLLADYDVEISRYPAEKIRADDDRVELALRDWPTYVACQVKKADREAWATPTPERLAHRLQISEQRVRAALKRLGR